MKKDIDKNEMLLAFIRSKERSTPETLKYIKDNFSFCGKLDERFSDRIKCGDNKIHMIFMCPKCVEENDLRVREISRLETLKYYSINHEEMMYIRT